MTGSERRGGSAGELAVLGLLTALLFGGKLALAWLPNIEPVSLLVLVYALVFGRDVFYIVFTFILLEGLVFGTVAEGLECVIAVMAENLHERFDLTDINETLDNYAPRFHMHTLAEQLKAVAEQWEKWGGMLAQTYRALCGRLPEE